MLDSTIIRVKIDQEKYELWHCLGIGYLFKCHEEMTYGKILNQHS